MDFHTGLVCVAVVVLSAVVVFVISMIGIKEKTYEEAIAEQRKMPEQNLLLGRANKDKNKDKKQKKLGKKTKEKPAENEKSNKLLTRPIAIPVQDKTRVEFEDSDSKVVNERPQMEDKKKKKKEKVRPILVNKEEQSLVIETPIVPVNHFEEIQPKDDLLLKRKESEDKKKKKKEKARAILLKKEEQSHVLEAPSLPVNHFEEIQPKDDLFKHTETKEDVSAEPAVSEPNLEHEHSLQKTPVKQIAIKSDKKADKISVTAVQQELTSGPASKERTKKKKNELATLQQMSGDREGVNISLLAPLVRKSELSRSEIQILIDLLLNKQQNSAVENSEWIEGRQDMVVKLKKQLAEKEKALLEEQEVTQSFQIKLKELRSEFNLERSRLGQSNRQFEESLVTKQNELKALAARLQHAHETHVAEKQALTQQNQQAEVTFKTQIGKLHAQLQEQENINATLSSDVQKLRESQMTKDGENNILREQISHFENQIRHLDSQTVHFKETTEHAQELARQIEELHRIKNDLEMCVATSRQHESSLQFESGKLHEELDRLKEKYNELVTENEKLIMQSNSYSDLQLEIQHFQEENERLLSQMSMYSHLEDEAQQLREENETLAAQLTAMTERPAAEGRENEDHHYTEEKQDDFSQQESMMKQNEVIVEKLSEQLKEKDYLLEKLSSEMQTYKTDIRKLNEELESQRSKNNEVSLDVQTEQQKSTKTLLQRIFPAIKIEEHENYDAWIESFESGVKIYLSQQKSQTNVHEDHSAMLLEVEKQNAQLQAMVTHYKTIIEETEGMLNKLQNHVEQEEARWRQQLQMKESELESVKEERDILEQSLEQLQAAEGSGSGKKNSREES